MNETDSSCKTWNDLNNTLISLPIFSCKICHQFLVPPIRLLADSGHICGSCKLPEDAISIHDSALEVILEKLIIPCPNIGNGCKQKLAYHDVSAHISTCLSRNYKCPFNFITNCNWEGSAADLLNHAQLEHSENVAKKDDGRFAFHVDVSLSNDTVYLLVMNDEKFILRIKCDLHKSKLSYFVYYIGSPEKGQRYSFFVKQTSKSDNFALQSNTKQKVLHDIRFKLDGDEDGALSVDLSLVKPLAQGPLVATMVGITYENNWGEGLENVMNLFKCPNCNNFMTPPIYLCLKGHSICNNCRSKTQQCVECPPRIHTFRPNLFEFKRCKLNEPTPSEFGNTRNYTLEALSNGIKFPCKYRDLGCNVVELVSDVNKHNCKVKPYACPIANKNCGWSGPYVDMIAHLKEQHTEKCKLSNYIEIHEDLSLKESHNIYCEYCLIVNDNVFRLSYERDTMNRYHCWTVQYVGPQNEAKNYRYEIGLLNVKNANHKIIICDLCQELTDYASMFKDCVALALPTNVVTSKNNITEVTYYCKIMD